LARLDRLIDAALASTLLVAPLFMGGRGPTGKLVLVLLAAVATVAYFAQQSLREQGKWRWSGTEWLILAAAMLVVAQLTPLPQALLHGVSPAISDLLPVWQDGTPQNVRIGTWSTPSLTPDETRGGLTMVLAFASLFLLFIQRLNSITDIERYMKWMAVAAAAMATLGMAQLLFGNGDFLWIYDHPSRDTLTKVNGTFQNQNHFAHFLALGVGPLIWWIQRQAGTRPTDQGRPWREKRGGLLGAVARHALPVGLGIVIVAGLLTYSRGGVLTLALAILLTAGIFWSKSLLTARRSLLAAGVFGGIICVALGIYGYDRLSAKMATLASGSFGQVASSRLDLWRAQWEAIPRFAALGAGIGSHRDVYPIYMEEHYDLEFAYGENGYFQLLLEAGVGGLLLALIGFGVAIRCGIATWIARDSHSRLAAMAGAVLPGLAASLFHSWGDFVWYIPACLTMTLLSAACAVRIYQISRWEAAAGSHDGEQSARATIAVPRWACLACTAVALLVGVCTAAYHLPRALAVPHWDAYLRLARASDRPQGPSEERERLDQIERHLEQVLRYDSSHARAHLRMAAVKLRKFELFQQSAANPMGLSQIRDAALASAFPTKERQDAWLALAVGENRWLLDGALRHSRMAVKLSPLQGRGYTFLAELSFLEDPREVAKQAFIQQAVLVRPHDGFTLFAVGKEAALAGDVQRAIETWRRAFHQDPDVQMLIIESLAGQMPAADFLGSFAPDVTGLKRLYYQLSRQGIQQDAVQVGEQLAEALRQEATAARPDRAASLWHEAQAIYASLGRSDAALDCQRRAVELAPHDFKLRRGLALLLVQTAQYSDAAAHLEWCLRRNPGDDELRRHLADVKMSLTLPARTADVRSESIPRAY
jgi:tetratricopeptide (TPR) repeat protein/O-antigen ligase